MKRILHKERERHRERERWAETDKQTDRESTLYLKLSVTSNAWYMEIEKEKFSSTKNFEQVPRYLNCKLHT